MNGTEQGAIRKLFLDDDLVEEMRGLARHYHTLQRHSQHALMPSTSPPPWEAGITHIEIASTPDLVDWRRSDVIEPFLDPSDACGDRAIVPYRSPGPPNHRQLSRPSA